MGLHRDLALPDMVAVRGRWLACWALVSNVLPAGTVPGSLVHACRWSQMKHKMCGCPKAVTALEALARQAGCHILIC